MFVLLHMVKGTPWEPNDQGEARMLTQWEQLDHGKQFTGTRKFFTVVPIVLLVSALHHYKQLMITQNYMQYFIYVYANGMLCEIHINSILYSSSPDIIFMQRGHNPL